MCFLGVEGIVSKEMASILARLEDGIDTIQSEHPVLEARSHVAAHDRMIHDGDERDDEAQHAEEVFLRHRAIVEELSSYDDKSSQKPDLEREKALLWRITEIARESPKDLQGMISVGAHAKAWGALLRHPQEADLQLLAAEAICALAFGSAMSRRVMARDGLREEIGCYLFSNKCCDHRVAHRLGAVVSC